jgi:hypothetical protein
MYMNGNIVSHIAEQAKLIEQLMDRIQELEDYIVKISSIKELEVYLIGEQE